MSKQLARLFGTSCTLFVLSIFFLFNSKDSFATISACSASVDTHTVSAGSESTFTFDVTNNDVSNNVVWVKLTRPSAYFTINTGDNQEYNIIETTMQPASSGSFGLMVAADTASQATANWTVEASDDSGGADAISCTGDLGTEINDGSNPVAIVSLTVSSVTDTSVNISWTTSSAANSTVNFGLTSDYGTTESDATQVSSHSISLTGLTANTSYHYSVTSTDGTYSDTTSDNTFTTAVAGSTSTTTTTVVVTQSSSTSSSSSSSSSSSGVDVSSPTVKVLTEFENAFEQAPKITGTVTDNRGVASAEYSLDGGKNWLPVDTVSKVGATSVTYSFTPDFLSDDNYKVKVRAKDTSGNIGVSREYIMVIDRIPPQVGASITSIGPQILQSTNGAIYGLAGLDQKITLSAIGGAVSIDLISGKSTFSLIKNPDNGLWSGILSFANSGVYQLQAVSIDGADNKTVRKLSSVIILPNGHVTNGKSAIKDALISIFVKDPVTKQFVLWDGAAFGQKSPQKTDASGNYKLFMPAGTYYLDIAAKGYKRVKTNIFTLEKSVPIDSDFVMKERRYISIGEVKIPLPDISQESATVELSSEKVIAAATTKNSLVGKAFPDINLKKDDELISASSFAGKPTVVSLLNSWDPNAFPQISILEDSASDGVNIVTIFEQESASKTSIFKKKGGYNITMLSDFDGELVEPLSVQNLPIHVFLDRKGVIKSIKYGVLNKNEVSENLIN